MAIFPGTEYEQYYRQAYKDASGQEVQFGAVGNGAVFEEPDAEPAAASQAIAVALPPAAEPCPDRSGLSADPAASMA